MTENSQGTESDVSPFIDGRFPNSDIEATVEVINPSNGRHLLSIPAGCESDASRAAAFAPRALQDGRWSEAAPSLRKRALHKFADLIEGEGRKLGVLDAEEMGKPVGDGGGITAAAEMMHFHEVLLYGRNERGNQYSQEWLNWYLQDDSSAAKHQM